MIKWLGENWFKILISLVFIVGIVVVYQSCQNSDNEEKIDANDKEILELKKKNGDLEGVAFEATETAQKWENKAKEKEDLLIARQVEIDQLKKDLKKVPEIIMELPPSKLVEEMQEILDCAEIELFYFFPTEPKVLFSENCARAALTELAKFSLIKREIGLIEQSQIDCQDALTFQKLATWNVYRIAWSQGSQILNYKAIDEERVENFSLLKKQKKKAWLNGATKGFLAGVALIVIISLARG